MGRVSCVQLPRSQLPASFLPSSFSLACSHQWAARVKVLPFVQHMPWTLYPLLRLSLLSLFHLLQASRRQATCSPHSPTTCFPLKSAPVESCRSGRAAFGGLPWCFSSWLCVTARIGICSVLLHTPPLAVPQFSSCYLLSSLWQPFPARFLIPILQMRKPNQQ